MAGEPIKIHNTYSSDIPAAVLEAPPEKLVIDDEPLTAFFVNLPHAVRAELSGWMTFRPEDRQNKVRTWVKAKEEKNFRFALLSYIIWYEAFHPSGDSKIAALAFRGLFPKHMKEDAF